MQRLIYTLVLVFLIVGCQAPEQDNSSVLRLEYDPGGTTIALTLSGELLTIYRFSDTLYKPLFFPLNTLGGNRITRGYPFDPQPGEPVDHPHQSGVWFTYGDVNGIDFWNNSYAVPDDKKQGYGRIYADSVFVNRDMGNGCGFTVFSSWKRHDGTTLLHEKTDFIFAADTGYWLIRRHTDLIAEVPVIFGDNKEGLFAVRLAREFQSDYGRATYILKNDLYPSEEKMVDDEGKNGHYMASNGKEGSAVWGTSAKWVAISAVKDRDSVSVAIFDHPGNTGFPSHWHARDYGLFSVNNLGRHAYVDSLNPLRLELQAGDSVVLTHELIVKSDGFLSREEIGSLYNDFIQNKEP
jgi:hypothetical protein